MMAEGNEHTRVIHVEIENELRILIDEETHNVSIELESGLAEIYGAEMTLNRVYKFPPNASIGIFTWHGCTIKITGKTKSIYVVKDTLMMLNVILHAYLQERRNLAELQNTRGPVTLIVGPTDVGKSTLCRFLSNYAARLGKRPLYVDLDVGQNSISVPGTVGILSVEKPADIVEGYEVKAAKVYQFGYKSPGHNLILYFLLLKHLGQVIKLGLQHANPNVKSSGIIINTCGWVRGHGYDAITHAALAFEIDTLCVLGEERLYNQLLRDMPGNVKVYYMPKFDGVVERARLLRVRAREAKTAEYFYGPLYRLRPTTFEVKYSEIKIYTVAPQPVYDDFDSTTVALHNIEILPVRFSIEILNQVLALMKISDDEVVTEDLALTEVIGFVCVKRVQSGKITFLSPQPKPLPSNVLLLGDRRLFDQLMDIRPIV